MNRALLSVSALFIGASALWAAVKSSGDWTYTVNEAGEAVITAYKGAAGDVVVPAEIDGVPVRHIGESVFASSGSLPDGAPADTSAPRLTGIKFPDGLATIGGMAFLHCDGLVSVVIPDSVTSIGGSAFLSCASVTNLTLGKGLQTLGDGAFNGLERLASVSLPAGLTNVGTGVFGFCAGLGEIEVSPENPALRNIDGVLFDKPGTRLLQFPPGKAGDFTVPDGVVEIAKDAFASAGVLTAVSIPATVTNWPAAAAFSGCKKLTNIAVSPDNQAFLSIDGVLFDKAGATLLQYPPGRAGDYTVPDGVTSIADEAFYGATELSRVVLPAGLERVGRSSFGDCSSLTNVVIPDSVASLGQWAFVRAAALTSVEIPAGIQEMGKWVFNGCSSLAEIVVDPDNPAFSSKEGVLFDRDGKTLVHFPGAKTGSYAVPETVTAIAPGAFGDAVGLDNISFPPALSGQLDAMGLPDELAAKIKAVTDAPTSAQNARAISSLTVGEITYQNVVLRREFPQSLFIKHDGGLAFLERDELSEDQIAGLLGTVEQ